ncbi:hypothetical protein SAMN05421858_3244 [Haladaptatus litoreus]|uniref:Uncharacterized protein n=1 Tax=Haladaptatus litoreus TaxID=553468 RepID=A0A1N7CTK1_9EURY|nr:hypothetical protein SAMN05421858_3244 [Haladaptatus litoreus]
MNATPDRDIQLKDGETCSRTDACERYLTSLDTTFSNAVDNGTNQGSADYRPENKGPDGE